MALTIFAVDNQLANRVPLIERLVPQGYLIAPTVNRQAALEEFARNQPGLVLLDIVMPKLDGKEVCRRL